MVVGDRLVVHAPRAADDFQLTILYKTTNLGLGRVVLLVPPHFQESGFHVNKSARIRHFIFA